MKKPIVHCDKWSDVGFITYCGLGEKYDIPAKIIWRGVTCKNCLKHKPRRK